jgi:hypothetical protein
MSVIAALAVLLAIGRAWGATLMMLFGGFVVAPLFGAVLKGKRTGQGTLGGAIGGIGFGVYLALDSVFRHVPFPRGIWSPDPLASSLYVILVGGAIGAFVGWWLDLATSEWRQDRYW